MITFHISDAPVTVLFVIVHMKASAQFSILLFYRSHIGNCIYGILCIYKLFSTFFQAFPIYSLIMLLIFFYLCITIFFYLLLST